jgi:shikimate dehydrogenase
MPSTFCPELVGSMSQGAAGNPTVAMVEAAFAHHGLAWRYINMEVAPEALPAAVAGAKALGFRGFNLSLPHKVSVIPLLDGLGESAALMGAVNCVVRRGDRFIGENTDGKGFLKSLSEVVDPRGKTVVLLGAGGASRAIAVELALAGVGKITVLNRSAERGTDLTSLLNDRTQVPAVFAPWTQPWALPADCDILINGTSIGLYDPVACPPIDLTTLRPATVVADVVFSPARTRLLQEAAGRGCVTVDGLGMLVNQGVIGIEFWTGLQPDAAVMREALHNKMQ